MGTIKLNIMEKEFIPYKQALALKELGFNPDVFKSYDTSVVNLDGQFLLDYYYNVKSVNEVKAPLYQQAFRWFREKYGLFHSITEYNKDGSLIIEISKDRVEIFRKMTNFDFTEYRESELECLKKLIEILNG